jgi:hypothetical protein
MARRSSSSLVPSWLRHRQLLTTEAVLLVAVGMELLQRYITSRQDVPWWAKTLLVMATNAGLMGGLLLVLTTWTRGSLSGATRAVQAVPVPAPFVLLHLAGFGGIFYLYARIWGYWPMGLN